MSTIEEQRKRTISEQIHKMAGTTPEFIAEPESHITELKYEGYSESSDKTEVESYAETFFINKTLKNRASSSLSRDTLDLLKHILYELGGKASLSAYVENILREHISTHRDIINKAIEENRIKPRII